jgi:hypothetical protein
LSAVGSDPASRPLLESTLDIMHFDYNMPASSDLIEAVRDYIKSPLFSRSLEDTTQNNGNESKTVSDSYEDKKRIAVVNLFSPLLGGLNSAELLDIIPKVIIYYCIYIYAYIFMFIDRYTDVCLYISMYKIVNI